MTYDDIVDLADAEIWGKGTHWFRHDLNEEEGQLYLHLERRSTGSATFRCEVCDPNRFETFTQFAQEGPDIIVRYPMDFKEAKTRYESAPYGKYRVAWLVQMIRAGRPYMERIARKRFKVPGYPPFDQSPGGEGDRARYNRP